MSDSLKKSVDNQSAAEAETDNSRSEEISLVRIRVEVVDSALVPDFTFQASWMPHKKKNKTAQAFRSGTEDSPSGEGPPLVMVPVLDEGVVASGSSSSLNQDKKPLPPPASGLDLSKQLRGRRTPGEISIETFQAALPRGKNGDDSTEEITFFSGNPFVEKTEGLLHIYKRNEMTSIREEDGRRSEMLCMLAVPATLTSQDLLQFISAAHAGISKIRIVRDASPNLYMVLIRFREQKLADEFYRNYDGMQYNALETNTCHLVYVAQLETVKESEEGARRVEGHTELPTCPVCLERMDESVDGILTILCNHSFHGLCLSQWGDTSCPVCRYCQTPELTPDHMCTICGKNNDLWICLICGHIGCGRYEQAHAFQHFRETSHTFSLQVGTQRVWDYAGDNYVHRLIQSKGDGKVVEFEPPNRNPEDVAGEEKIEGITLEYTYLLTNQLESQRQYFEIKLANIEKMAQAQVENLELQMKAVVADCEKLSQELKTISDKKASLDKKLQTTTSKLEKTSGELKEEQLFNKVLRSEQHKWAEQVKLLEKRLATSEDKRVESEEKRKNEVSQLKENMRDLMFHLEGRDKLAAAEEETGNTLEEGEIQNANLVLADPPVNPTAKKRHRKKK